MNLLFDSFWRALLYCLRPRVIALSLVPLLLMVGLSLGLAYFFWAAALAWVDAVLQGSTLINSASNWLPYLGLGNFRTWLAPLLVIFSVTPLIVLVALLLVAFFMTPALASLVAKKRFPGLQRHAPSSLYVSVIWSLFSTLLALFALLLSMPLWLIPPLILIFPPLIWGWLNYRVMAFDVLAEHASADERREIFRRHRGALLVIGVFCAYLGTVPSLILAAWALLGAAFVALLPLAVWLYTLVFAMSSLWFAHFCLAALASLRSERAAVAPTPLIAASAAQPMTT